VQGDFGRDLRTGVRTLVKKPGFTIVVVLMLAVGIATNTAIFSVVNGVLWRPLPYADDDRVVTIWQTAHSRGIDREETSPADFFDWQQRSQSFDAFGMAEPWGHLMTGDVEPEAVRSWVVSPGFFEALGARPFLGRTFLPEEYLAGSSPVVIVGYKWWQNHFGNDPNLVGRKLSFNNQATTVVGIMPPEFEYPPGRQMWAPRPRRDNDMQNRGRTFIFPVGRLKPARSREQAQQEMNAIGRQLADEYPPTNAGIGVALVPLRQILLGNVRPALLVLFGAVGLVLLMACANIANLYLARAAERQREFTIRSTLGASRGRMVRQLMTESLMLAGVGGTLGVLLSAGFIRVIVALSANRLPRIEGISIDSRVLLFAMSISILTALLFGLAPAFQATRMDLNGLLKESTHTATAGSARQYFRRALMVMQVAAAFVLLAGAGLLARSFVALLEIDPGFAASKALTLEVQMGRRTTEQRTAFINQTLEKVSGIPGVAGAGAASALPFSDNQVAQPTTIRIEGRPSVSPEGDATTNLISVTPDYFNALRVPLLSGRALTRFDTKDVPVAVINQTMAVRYWPGEDPIGKKVSFRSYGGDFTAQIVGVVGDVHTKGLETPPKPEMFVSHASAIGYPNSMTYFVRTATDPLTMLPAIKDKIREVSREQAFSSVATIDQLVEKSLNQRRFNLLLLASFAVLALILAGVGLYGLISFMTAQRTTEIGIRVAFGADRRNVVRLIVGQGMALTLVGVVIGLLASLALTRLIESLLFGISATDPLTFLVITLVVSAVPLLACYIPARRATKVDPIQALRCQ
jgi:putative ABC transport system permease protein